MVSVLLLGEIITVLGMPGDSVIKFGTIVSDIGVAGALWSFLQKLSEGNGGDVYRAALAIAAAVLIAFAW